MPFCRDCGKGVQADWVTCPYCSASMISSTPVEPVVPVAPITPDIQGASKKIGIQDTVVMGNVSINDTQQSPAAQHIAGMQPTFTTIVKPNNSEMVENTVAITVTVVIIIGIIIGGIWAINPGLFSSDDDNDGIHDDDDWYDEGNGGLAIEFTIFDIWGDGYYDDGGGNPDVYAYVGVGDGNCNNMEYFEYLDSIHEDVASMRNWDGWAMDIPDDQQLACVKVMIYDEDSWAPDEVLDYVPGSANHYVHTFNLAAGEGDTSVSKDNRGENELSIRLAYKISRVAVAS